MKNLVQGLSNFVARVAERFRQTAQIDAERAGLGVPNEAAELPSWANRKQRRTRRARLWLMRKGARGHRWPGAGIARRIAAGGKVRGY